MKAVEETYVNCGAFRPKWLKPKSKRVNIRVNFTIEVPEFAQAEAVEDLRVGVLDMLSRWSRSQWVKLQKENDRRKRVKQ